VQLFNNSATINSREHELISNAFLGLQQLTPVNKNVQRNDINIANGALIRIDNALIKNT